MRSLVVFVIGLCFFGLVCQCHEDIHTNDKREKTGSCGLNLRWSFVEALGTLTISGLGEMDNYTYSTYPSWDSYKYSIRHIIIERGATSVGNCAFFNYPYVEDIYIPSTVTYIGDSSFSGCENVQSLTIPSSVKVIASSAFARLKGVKTLEIPSSVQSIGIFAFYGMSNLVSVVIPSSIKSLPQGVFQYCYSLSSVTLPDGIELIDYDAFANCSSLTSFTFPANLKTIGCYAFSHCTSLENVSAIPAKVTSIEHAAFTGCPKITSFSVSSQNKDFVSIDGVLFTSNKSILVAYPNGKKGAYTIPATTKKILTQSFQLCKGLTSVKIPSSVTDLNSFNQFHGCTSLTTVENSAPITILDWDAFSDCINLVSVTLPSTLKRIDNSAFENCRSLKKVSIPSSVTSISSDAFKSCVNLEMFNVSSSNSNYKTVSGVLFNKNGTTLLAYPCGKSGTSYTIPQGTTTIATNSFYECPLTTVSIPNSVTKIDSDAFSKSGIKTIEIPSSVTTLGSGSFKECTNLTTVKNYATITTIATNTFRDCSKLVIASIPSTVKTIGDYAFKGCVNLEKLTIPTSVTSFGRGVFDTCSSLNTIEYYGYSSPSTSSIFSFNDPPLVCVPSNYTSTKFCGDENLCDMNSCDHLSSLQNKCYRVSSKLNEGYNVQMKNTVSSYLRGTSCFKYVCDNNTGLSHSFNCSSSEDDQLVCAYNYTSYGYECEDLMSFGSNNKVVAVDVNYSDFSRGELETMLHWISGCPYTTDISIATRRDDNDLINTLFITLDPFDEDMAQNIVDAINQLIEKGKDNCEDEYGILCSSTSVRLVELENESSNNSSSIESAHPLHESKATTIVLAFFIILMTILF